MEEARAQGGVRYRRLARDSQAELSCHVIVCVERRFLPLLLEA